MMEMQSSSSPDIAPVRDVDPVPSTNSHDPHGFFNGWTEGKRYTVHELIGKGSYGVVCAATDNATGEKVAIKKIQNVFDNVADATRILREITLLRLLKHADIVDIKHICLPSDPRTFKDLYVVFELMESDLHTVIGANDDLTGDHHKVFLYQLLRGLNYIHQSGVLHRDLKPKNILANSNCKLKICDFGLARPFLAERSDTPVLWTDYVATRWYRAPELCGCFYGRYSQAVDIWSIGCIFAEILLGKPLFPGRDAVMQLTLITDLLGKPSQSVIDRISNQKARAFLQSLPPKPPRAFESKFPNADMGALDLLRRLLAFDPVDRPTAAEALQHPYFAGLPNATHQADTSLHTASHFEFEHHKLQEADVRGLIYAETLHYHPNVMAHYKQTGRSMHFSTVSSGSEDLRRQFHMLEAQQQQQAHHARAAAAAAQQQRQQQQAAAAVQQQQQQVLPPAAAAPAQPSAPWKAHPAGGVPYHQRDTLPPREQHQAVAALQQQYAERAAAAAAGTSLQQQQQALASLYHQQQQQQQSHTMAAAAAVAHQRATTAATCYQPNAVAACMWGAAVPPFAA